MSIEKQTYRSGPLKKYFAQAVKVGDLLHISGQVGMDQSGKVGADITKQTQLAYENIKAVLAEFGASMDNIVDETLFVTDMHEIMSNTESVFAVREAAYGGTPEVCQTLVQVTALVMPALKIEIKCVAQL